MNRFPRRRRSPASQPETIARGLGWFSVGMGVAQLLAPRVVARIAGVPAPVALTVMCGVRELVCGAGLLKQRQPATWMKARVAGDTIDLAGLALGAAIPGTSGRRIGLTAAFVGGVTLLDLYTAWELSRGGRPLPPQHEALTIDVAQPPETLYAFWRELANLPQVMPHLRSVQVLDETHSHWVAAGPAGTRIEWDAEIIDDNPGRCLAWRSLEGAPFFNAGSVQFHRLGEQGTRVRVEILYQMPAGTLGEAVGQLFGIDPAHQARVDLQRFKAQMEKPRLPA